MYDVSAPAFAVDPMQLRDLVQDTRVSEAAKLAHVSEQFESTLLRQFLKDALNPVIKGWLDEEGSGREIYQFFLTDALAGSMAKGNAFGFSSLLQMHAQTNPAPGTGEEAVRDR